MRVISRRTAIAGTAVLVVASVGIGFALGRATADRSNGSEAAGIQTAVVTPSEVEACDGIVTIAAGVPNEGRSTYTIRATQADGAGTFETRVLTDAARVPVLALSFGVPAAYTSGGGAVAPVEGRHVVTIDDESGHTVARGELVVHPEQPDTPSTCSSGAT